MNAMKTYYRKVSYALLLTSGLLLVATYSGGQQLQLNDLDFNILSFSAWK
jgi:hypothetical protein